MAHDVNGGCWYGDVFLKRFGYVSCSIGIDRNGKEVAFHVWNSSKNEITEQLTVHEKGHCKRIVYEKGDAVP